MNLSENLKRYSLVYKNVLWLLAEKCLTIFLVLFCDGLLARSISVEEFGQWQYALNLATIIGCVSFVAGGSEVIVPALARNETLKSEIITAGLVIRTTFSIITIALAALAGKVYFGESYIGELVVMAVVIVVATETIAIGGTYFQSITKIKAVVICRLTALALRAVLFYVAYLYSSNLLNFILIRNVEILAYGIFLAFLLLACSVEWRPNIKIIATILARGIKFLPPIIAMYVYARLDRIYIEKYFSYHYVAIYTAAQQYVEQCFILITIIVQSLSPKYILSVRDKKLLLNRAAKIGLCLVVLALAMICATQMIGSVFISLVFGEKYLTSFYVMRVLILAAIPFSVDTLITQILLKEKAANLILIKWLIMALFSTFMYQIIVPLVGLSYIQFVYVLNYTVMAILSLIIIRWHHLKKEGTLQVFEKYGQSHY